MPSSREDDHTDRKRSRKSFASRSPDREQRRRRDDHYAHSSRRHHRSSRRDSSRRRSSHSPSSRTSHRKEYERRHPERTEDPDDDRKRLRHRSPEERSHRRHYDRHDRLSHNHKEKSSRRDRSYSRSRSRSPDRSLPARSKAPLPSQQDAYKTEVPRGDDEAPPPEKEKPNFGNTGRLAAESNTVTVGGGTVVLKYHEPPEARKPPAKESWRLYVFKGKDLLEMVELNERSCWLIGRERLVVDFPLDHPSCSKQHAAIQFRFVEKRNEFGDRIGKVKPYVIDLESANGSKVNGELAPAGRYVELRDKDMLQFGLSSREYVLMLTQPD
ncbi:Putative Transcriptional regulator SNIP1 [Aspergillus calidoustus]|uniref:Putative Transcriptional regulator SNIP1 n=1 Tax=Aspergillus calidoustus TaxID=454130 RepID=A0A0U5GA02_ASPCI|nr:Putative Transcriptional regulator SNIP1 [Aspergillus calidoustus]